MSPTRGAAISTFEVHLLRLDVDLDELLRRLAPGLALAVRQEPVQARADQHHDIGVLQHRRARRARRLRVRVGQEAFRHAHRQERSAALLDEGADRIVRLGIGRALAEDDERALRALEHLEGALDGGGRRKLRRGRVDDLDERPLARRRIHDLAEELRRQIEIDAARTARDRGADGARDPDADVGRMQHAEGRLAQRLRDGELVHLLVVALLQVDDLALGRARDEDHREAVRGGVRQRHEAVKKAGRRNGEADAGLLREIAGDGGSVAGVLLVTERDDADALGLRHAAEVGDRYAGHAVDRLDAVELERVDDKMEAVRQLRLQLVGRRGVHVPGLLPERVGGRLRLLPLLQGRVCHRFLPFGVLLFRVGCRRGPRASRRARQAAACARGRGARQAPCRVAPGPR